MRLYIGSSTSITPLTVIANNNIGLIQLQPNKVIHQLHHKQNSSLEATKVDVATIDVK